MPENFSVLSCLIPAMALVMLAIYAWQRYNENRY